ncbi:MAG: hypothetical protein OHK0038_26390 [Flammeovirgaceae bacterium]
MLGAFLSFQGCKSSSKFSSKKKDSKKTFTFKYYPKKPITKYPEKKADNKVVDSSSYRSSIISQKQLKILETAESYLSTPHKMGGLSKKGIDCSGLVVVSYQAVGINLPRTSREQSLIGKPVSIDELQKGDLLFFSIGHVGIVYEVKGKEDVEFIHTPVTGVRKDNLFSKYWIKCYKEARRILNNE